MLQKFEVVDIDTDLFHRKLKITLSLAPDEETVKKDTIYIGEEDTGRVLDFNIVVNNKVIELDLLEWPKPNVNYNLFIQKGIMSIAEDELDAALRRKLVFESTITSKIDIISPNDNEKLKSLDIVWEEVVREAGAQKTGAYYIEISSDTGFYKIEKTSRVALKQNISLTDLPTGQYFMRIRAQKDDMYGVWSDVVTFYFGNSPSSSQGTGGSTGVDDTKPIVDMDVLVKPESGITPTAAVFKFSHDIDASSIKNMSLYNATTMANIDFTYTVNGSTLTITPKTAFADNETYNISIEELKSVSGSSMLNNFIYSFTTALSPMYCTIYDVNSVVGILDLDNAKILYYINQASKMVDWVRTEQSASAAALTAPYEYPVVQFTKYKAAKDALLSAMVDRASGDGVKGVLLDIQFDFENGTKSLKNVLKDLDTEIMKWQEAIRGYGPEGRQKPLYAVKASKSTPTTNSVNSLKGSTDRSTGLGGSI